MTGAVLDELCAADMVIWVLRANRPAREIDRAAIATFDRRFADMPERRKPPRIVVISGIDQIVTGWPFPENLLTDDAMARVSEIVAAVARDIGDSAAHPLPVVLVAPEWNTGTLRDRVQARLTEGFMVQRNRLRIENRKTSLREEVTRAGRGVRQGFATFGARLAPKRDKDDPPAS